MKLQAAGIEAEEILELVDSIVVNYSVIKRDAGSYNSDVLDDFLYRCKYEQMSNGTIENYQYILDKMFEELNLPIAEICHNDLRVFLREYQNQRNISDSTLKKYAEYIRAFFTWAFSNGYITTNPAKDISKIRCEKKQRESLTQMELEYIRKACVCQRDLAIVEFLYSTGCRVSELCGAQLTDINWNTKSVHLFGKGKKHRVSYLNAKAEFTLKAYLQTRDDNCEFLFVTERGQHQMSTAAVERIFRNIAKELEGVVNKPITPHIFRHTMATMALRHGMPVEDIQLLLGHENIETTMAYAKPDPRLLHTMHLKYVV